MWVRFCLKRFIWLDVLALNIIFKISLYLDSEFDVKIVTYGSTKVHKYFHTITSQDRHLKYKNVVDLNPTKSLSKTFAGS